MDHELMDAMRDSTRAFQDSAQMPTKTKARQGRRAEASFSSVNWGEKHCIRIPVAFCLYLVKII
jgi:hypothetical protein